MSNSIVLNIAKNFNLSPISCRNIKEKRGNNFTSLYAWLGTNALSQSFKIQSGYKIEEYIKELVIKSPKQAELLSNESNILISNTVEKQTDLVFQLDNIIYYREIKCNVNLDSEKSKITYDKIDDITSILSIKYSYQTINGKLFCPAWLYSNKNIEGFNNFLDVLGYEKISADEHCKIGKLIGNKIIEKIRE